MHFVCNFPAAVELVRKLLSGKIDWSALKAAAESLGLAELAGYDQVRRRPRLSAVFPRVWRIGLSAIFFVLADEQFSEQLLEDDEFVRNAHRVLFDVHVITGHLVCPETGRKFPIKDGIPNMLLNEDEV